MYTNKQLSEKLKNHLPKAGLIDTLKISYRPYICPFKEIIELAGTRKKVFDIGCGSGMFLMLMAECSSPHMLGGIEISENLVNNAKHLLSSYDLPVKIEQYNGTDIPENIKEFDSIFMIDVLHHIDKTEQEIFINNLYKKLTPGTVFYFKDINAASPLVYMNKLHDMVLSNEIGDEISQDDAERLLKNAGFKIISSKLIRTLWYPHYLIISQK